MEPGKNCYWKEYIEKENLWLPFVNLYTKEISPSLN
jgi:hypothetical protein